MPTIGERLKSFRESMGLSQKDAAQQAGISQASWSDYENDEKLPRVRQAMLLARLTKDTPFRIRLKDIADAETAREVARHPDPNGDTPIPFDLGHGSR